MAKNNNLKDFLTGVAEAIRTKKGTTDLINPQDFESEISGISTGKPEQEKTVNLNMAEGNQVIEPEVGNVLSKVTVNKPDTLIPNNIKEGVSIGGVEGTFVGKKPEQEKSITVTENGTQEVTPDEGKVLSKVTVVTEVGTGGGDQPVMNAPTISLSGRQLTMTNPSTNGNFFSKFKVFVDNTLKSSQTEKTIDLYTYFDEDGTYNLAAKCSGTNFQDSEASNSVSYTKFTPTGGVVWYGNATALANKSFNLTATTVGNYALFGGGIDSNSGPSFNTTITAYDQNLTRTTQTGLSQGRQRFSATTVGNYALFGGGSIKDSVLSSVVDAYDQNLTRTIPTELSQARSSLAATTVGNYALFGGGYIQNSRSNVVDAYDQNLTRTIPTELSQARSSLAATTVGNYALFGGGSILGGYSITVDAYDTSLTHTVATSMYYTRTDSYRATTVGNYALFAGGGTSNVEAYDISLTRTTAPSLSKSLSSFAATTIGNYALFGGGTTNINLVHAYDSSLTKTMLTELSEGRGYLSATTVGNYALFGGGIDSNSKVFDIVDVYTVQ